MLDRRNEEVSQSISYSKPGYLILGEDANQSIETSSPLPVGIDRAAKREDR